MDCEVEVDLSKETIECSQKLDTMWSRFDKVSLTQHAMDCGTQIHSNEHENEKTVDI